MFLIPNPGVVRDKITALLALKTQLDMRKHERSFIFCSWLMARFRFVFRIPDPMR